MGTLPDTTVKVTRIEPAGETKVRITMELCVDVHRLAEVGSDLLHSAVAQVKAQDKKKNKSAV